MTRSLLLLAAFTVGIIVAAYVYKIGGLEFLALISGIVFLVKCSQAINFEREEQAPEREARRLADEEGDED